MAVNPDQLDRNWLQKIVEDGFFSDPRQFRQHFDQDPSPIEDMLGSSQLLDYVRQRLPHKVADTAAGRWINRKLDTPEDPESLRSALNAQIQDLPGGGFSDETLALREQARAEDPLVRRNTVQAGMVNTPDGLDEVPIGDSFRAGAAQAAGVTAGDLASDGLRNVWWFLNAPQALASLAVLQAIHQPAKEQAKRLTEELALELPENAKIMGPHGSRRVRMAAAVPAVIGVSIAVGNFGRQPGFKAALPSEADPTQTADPLGELGARFFLGRTGELLAYDEFAKERPDVSKAEFDAYKAYLFGSPSPIKASLDGINGPEVNFMGKSMPVLTGILPAVAAAVGARRGMRKAMDRLAASPDGDLLKQAERARIEYSTAEQKNKSAEEIEALKNKYLSLQRGNEKEMLKQTLLGSAVHLAPTALIGQTLESIRRSIPSGGDFADEPAPAKKPVAKKPVNPQDQLQPQPAQ